MRTLGVARHEAAHAVVGVHLGLSLKRAVIKDPLHPEWEGYARFRYAPTKRLAFGVMTQAGPAGDILHGASEFEGLPDWIGDIRLAQSHGFCAREIVMLRDLARYYLVGVCARPWRAVTEALLERDVTGGEVKRLLLYREPIDLDHDPVRER